MSDKENDSTASVGTKPSAAHVQLPGGPETWTPEAVAKVRQAMEAFAVQIRDLVLSLPPTKLIAYLWSLLLLHALQGEASRDSEASARHEKKRRGTKAGKGTKSDAAASVTTVAERTEQELVFTTMEYVHAVLSSFDVKSIEGELDEAKVSQLLDVVAEARMATTVYCMMTSRPDKGGVFGDATGAVELFAKTSWVNIRGNRFQVLEGEFFRFVLDPHSDALEAAYGATASQIAAGIQASADSMRTGFMDAAATIEQGMEALEKKIKETGLSSEEAMRELMKSPVGAAAQQAIFDLLFGGVANLSVHSTLPQRLLEDLAFERGTNSEFFADGEFSGTLMRTLPARVRPLIRLDGAYYAGDPNFVRDAMYRCIQRGLQARLPAYREQWNIRQALLAETAFEKILGKQLKGAEIFYEVYYPHPETGQWVENDVLILLDDVLVQVEAKAGAIAMQSPATNFIAHVRAVQNLVVKAYQQTKRFLTYANAAAVVPLYELRNGEYVQVHRLRLSDYRVVLPIGLTVESFAPFSAMCKELPDTDPILGRYPFVSVSIDDLFVLNRFLPTAGALFHYLEVRQQVAAIRQALVFDEMDHLGSYVQRNRFDIELREQFERGADRVHWDGFSQIVDDYFAQPQWEDKAPPAQTAPEEMAQILHALDRYRRPGWLQGESLLRDSASETRLDLAENIRAVKDSVYEVGNRYFVLGFDTPLLIWLQAYSGAIGAMEVKAAAFAVLKNVGHCNVIQLTVGAAGQYLDARYHRVAKPMAIELRLPEVLAEAERLRERLNL